MRAAVSSDCFKQFQRAWNTPDRLGRNDHGSIRDILGIRYAGGQGHFTTPRRQHLKAARRTERPGEGLLVGPAGRCRLGKPDERKDPPTHGQHGDGLRLRHLNLKADGPAVVEAPPRRT